MSDLTSRLQHAWDDPLTGDDGFDPLAELDDVLAPLGLSAADAGGAVTLTGRDPVVPSPVRVGAAASIGLLAKSVAAAALHRDRGGPGQDVHVDLRAAPHRLCPFYDRRWELLGGYPVASSVEQGNAMGFAFFRCADGGWVMPQNMYPNLRERAQELLGIPLTKAAVTEAIGRWEADELRGRRRGGRRRHAAGAHAARRCWRSVQYTDVLADLPLVEVTKIGDSDPEPLPPPGAQPFSGLRALGMGHVIAGAGFGRAFALHGADVLNLWRPGETEHETTYASANVGMRSAFLDPRRDRAELTRLLAGADVLFHNRRLAFLDEIGLAPGQAVAERPGLVSVTVSLHGLEGPWAGRPGFDQTAGSVTGMMMLEGGGEAPRLPPILVVNDYIVRGSRRPGSCPRCAAGRSRAARTTCTCR